MKINKGGNTGKRLFSSDKPSVIRLRYTLPVLFVVLLIFLKLPLLSIYFETVRLIITLAPMAAIVAVACYAFYHSHRGEKPNRLGYYLLILKILLAILAFYILYAPGEFFAFFQSLLGFVGSILTLEGLIFLSGPIAVISFLLFAGLLGYRSYQTKQGTYTGSITKLFKRLSFTLFFLFLALGSTIVMASPGSIKPMTDYLGDTIFTLSGGHIQVLKGTDVSQYKRLLSLKEMTSSLSTSLVDTSKNFSEAIEENKTTFKEDLSQSAQELASSISETTEDLKDKLEEDIDDKLPLGGGTLSGKLTIGKDLTVRGETEFEDTVNANDLLANTNDSYDLGSADKKWRRLYVSVLDLGTNTVSDGEFSGDWNFSGGNLSNVGTLSADSYNGLTLSSGSGTLDLGSYSLVLSGNANLNQHLTTTSSPTFLTLNTGQGDYELYAMDQNVLSSSSPSFSGLTLSGDLALGSNTLTTDNTDLVSNLNADLLDGQHGSYYLPKANVSGTDNYLAKFNGTDGLESSVIYESGGNIGIGTESPGGKFHLYSNTGLSSIIETSAINGSNAGIVFNRKNALGNQVNIASIGIDADGTNNVGKIFFKTASNAGISSLDSSPDMVIGNGNVGIGTTGPRQKLHIVGSDVNVTPYSNSQLVVENNGIGAINILSANDSVGSILFGDSNSNSEGVIQYDHVNDRFKFLTGSIDMVIEDNGNVGIGTTNPGAKLSVMGQVSLGSYSITQDSDMGRGFWAINGPNTDSSGLSYGVDLGRINPAGSGIYTLNLTRPNNAGIGFRRYTSGTFPSAQSGFTYDMVINNTGNVGIGTTSPGYKFSIGSTDASDQIGIYHDSSNAHFKTSDGEFIFQTDEGTDTMTSLSVKGKGTGAGEIKIYDGGANVYLRLQGWEDKGVIDAIGGQLSLQYLGNNDAYFFSGAAEGETPYVRIYGYRTGYSKTALNIGVSAIAADTASFTGLGNYYFSGNVGIGTIVPAQKLQVAGRIRMDTWTADGDVAVYYNSSTGDIGVTASDERLKTNIETIPNALSIVQNIRGITFNWKDKSMSGDKSIGIIAQEALAVMPELTFPITGPDGKEYLGVHYNKISPILIEAVKEQQEQISNLQLSVSNEFSILNDSMTNLDSRLFGGETSLEDKIAVIGADLTELEYDFKELAGRAEGQEELFDSLTVTTAGLTESVATLTEMYGDHETRIAALENMLVEGLSGGEGVPAELESLRELDSRLVLEDLGADGYRFDIDGNLKVKELEAEKIHAKEAAIEKLQIGKMKQVILESPSGACFKLEINDQGQIESEEVDCQAEMEE